MVQVQHYKVIVCGASNTGKTSFVQRFISGNFDKKYNPTLGVEVHPLIFNTNKGPIQFNAWDCAGSDEWKGLGKNYYINAHCAIVFVDDPLDRSSGGSVYGDEEWKQYIEDLRAIKHDLPIVLVRNKVDLHMHSGWNWSLVARDEVASKYYRYNISSKSNYNFEKPFQYLARELIGEDVVFVEGVPQQPEEPVNTDLVNKFEQSWFIPFQQ